MKSVLCHKVDGLAFAVAGEGDEVIAGVHENGTRMDLARFGIAVSLGRIKTLQTKELALTGMGGKQLHLGLASFARLAAR